MTISTTNATYKGPLIVLSVAGLAALNTWTLNVFALALAVVLAIIAGAYLTRFRRLRLGLSAFILAELSPISLHADLPLALAYQGLCVVLLSAVLSPADNVFELSSHASAALKTSLTALVPTGIGLALFFTKAVNATSAQLVSVAALALLGMIFIWLAVTMDSPSLTITREV